MTDTSQDAAAAPDAQASEGPRLPLFYQTPLPITVDRHNGKTLVASEDYTFAKGANSVPLNGNEFAAAVRFFPIVFSRGDNPVPVALLGLRSDQNLFVDKKGKWLAGAYKPDYVQRYPFIFLRPDGEERLILCIDEASPRLKNKGGDALFEDGEPSDALKAALDVCSNYQARYQATQEFCKALHEHGLLVEQAANITLKDGDKTTLQGFSVIDIEKLDRVRDATFLEWRKKGWLPLIYLHLASTQNWGALVDRAAEVGDA